MTRARPGADETAQRLSALNLEPLLHPALTLEPMRAPHGFDAAAYDGFVFTSANGVRFLGDSVMARTATAWCVGPATAAEARLAGFKDIRTAHGNADELTAFILDRSKPDGSARLAHIANVDAAGEVAYRLNAAGITCDFVPLYRTCETPLTDIDRVLEPLRAGNGAVLIHSAKGATSLASALTRADVTLEGIAVAAIFRAGSGTAGRACGFVDRDSSETERG